MKKRRRIRRRETSRRSRRRRQTKHVKENNETKRMTHNHDNKKKENKSEENLRHVIRNGWASIKQSCLWLWVHDREKKQAQEQECIGFIGKIFVDSNLINL